MSEQATVTRVVSSTPLIVRAVLRTDVGRVRSENQDFGMLTTPEDENGAQPGGRLLLVADGMGGHRGGATASRLAAETVKTEYLGSGTEDISAALRDALARANSKVWSEAQTNADLRGMGTTTSALAVRGNQAWFAHVGDSRIYVVRADDIRQLTDDHSLVASMVREGLLTAKEAESHPRRNVLQRSIGVSDDVEIDVAGPFDVQEYDTFILCSDGLHGVVKPDEIKDVALKMSIEDAADELVRRALERGGPDNITVIVARAERAGADPTIVDHAPYDETVADDASEVVRRGLPVAEEKQKTIVSDLPPATGEPRQEVRGGAVIKWALLFVLILSAAGVWLFLNQQNMFESHTPPSSGR